MTSTTPRPTVLVIGGTGTISSAFVHRAVAEGFDVTVVTRGVNRKGRALPEGATSVVLDVRDESATAALAELSADYVIDFLAFGPADVERMRTAFEGRVRQYIYISSASIYRKPSVQLPITESTLRHNPFLSYARDKASAEDALWAAFADSGFPATIVRPSHTYDDVTPPLPGGWTVLDRMERGEPIPVHGDGTTPWTLTHADDLAVALVGLLGNSRAIGEAFHITSDQTYTWDQIYGTFADALGVDRRFVHIPSEFYPLATPEWFWSDLIVGDLSHAGVFDNSKIRAAVPAFSPGIEFSASVRRMVAWRAEHPELTAVEADTDAWLTRLAAAHEGARRLFVEASA